jgi:L-iditol 2-dehydrogenase
LSKVTSKNGYEHINTEGSMLSLVNVAPGTVELKQRDVPSPEAGEVLLKVRAVAVCGSDLHQWHGTQSWKVNWPVTLGHEFCGEIVALGPGVTGWSSGDRVACETAARICGVCAMCRTGRYNLCPSRLGFGYGVDGAAAEYVAARAPLLHRLPADLPWEVAALTEPCCVAISTVLEQSSPRPGDIAVVIGPGTIGLLATAVLAGTRPAHLLVVGLERDAPRLAIAQSLGASHVIFADRENIVDTMRDLGDGLGADLVIDAAGVSASLRMALEVVRPAGQITKVGWGREPLNFSLDPLVAKAVRLQGSFSHTWATWERALVMLGNGSLDAQRLLKSYPLEAWHTAFDDMESGRVAKAVLIP